jgi:hypothetical protein
LRSDVNSEADAASLRRAFNAATETYPRHLAAFLSNEGEAAFRAWWGQLYEAVRDHQAGLRLLGELAAMKEENKKLKERLEPAAPDERG